VRDIYVPLDILMVGVQSCLVRRFKIIRIRAERFEIGFRDRRWGVYHLEPDFLKGQIRVFSDIEYTTILACITGCKGGS
jgi:hypothetical protein